MKRYVLLALCAVTISQLSNAQTSIPHSQKEDTKGYMSEAYWAKWNDEELKRIEQDIERFRKADGEVMLENIAKNSEVKIEQLSHEFKFGAHLFNYNQLGKTEYNERYKELYGTLFNSGTIAFYWRKFETEPGRVRFATEYWDSEVI